MKMPKQVFVFVSDYDRDQPLLAVVESVEDIPTDLDGQKIGRYKLVELNKLSVKRELVP